MSIETDVQTITVGHSPDPDDAFMFYALATERLDTGRYRFEHVMEDIETLNRRALASELDVTAVSFHAYPQIAADYALMPCGASMGDGYGPLLVARTDHAPSVCPGEVVAIPGTMTSAHLALKLFAGKDVQTTVVPFDEIHAAVVSGRADLGLLIHEGQLTYAELGVQPVLDLGRWWKDETGLPLPLGANAVRRGLGAGAVQEITRLVRASIRYALDHREAAVEYAREFGRGLDPARTDRFVGMYVNELTLDLGADGRRAAALFLERGARIGMVPDHALEFVALADDA